MQGMSDERTSPTDGAETRRRDHLSVVADPVRPPDASPLTGAGARPRSIGRLIAQTALIADGAINRRREAADGAHEARGVGRLLGRFR